MVAGPGPAVTLIEEGDNQDDEADILVVTETLPATARPVGQGAEGQGALVRNILEAEKALQACSLLLSLDPDYEGSRMAFAASTSQLKNAQNTRAVWTSLLASGLMTSIHRCCVCMCLLIWS